MRDLTTSATNALISKKKISSQTDITEILENLRNILPLLPTLTVQKLLKIDRTDFMEYIEKGIYKTLLETLIGLFDHSFPIHKGLVYQEIAQIFAVEDSSFFVTALEVAISNLKSKPVVLSVLIEIIFKGEGYFDFLMNNLTNFEDHEEKWQRFIQSSISIPHRVSNATEGQFGKFFKTQNFCKFLLFNVVKVVEFSTDCAIQLGEPLKLNYDKLGLLLGKILVNFNEHLNSEGVKVFSQIVGIFMCQQSPKQKLYQEVLSKLLYKLDKTAIEIFSVIVLKDLNPNRYTLKLIFGENLLKNENFRFTVCTKLPLYSHYEDETLIKNLIVYLAAVSHHLLFTLLVDLLHVWVDKSALNHTSVEHRLYIAKLILVILNCMKNIGLSKHESQIIYEKIHMGVTIHLENSIYEMRGMGMKLAEIALNFLSEERESEVKLNFDFDHLPDNTKKITESLQKLYDEDLSQYFKIKDIDVDVSELILQLVVQTGGEIPVYVPPERQLRDKAKIETNAFIMATKPAKNLIKIIDNTNFDLDSDDDLEPYDLSNDVKKSKKEPPRYLRDVKEGLLETQNADIFTTSVEIAEDLIVAQLADDDASLALELLEIFVVLDQRFFVQNFENLVFRTCVTITSIYPIECTNFLCKQFHADVGTYSISHRIFILDILSETAKLLSNITTNPPLEKKNIKRKKNPALESAEDVIKKRLMSKTRYFHKHKAFRTETMNKFAQVAGHFFFPLLYGYNRNKIISTVPQNDSDYILLIHFVTTLGIIMCSSQNCAIAPRMAKEILHFSWFLRFHKEVRVRMAVISLIGVAVWNTPTHLLTSDFLNELLEFRFWLSDLLSLNVTRGEPNLECRDLAASTMCILDNVLKVADE